MASGWYTSGLRDVLDRTIELSGTGYTGGFAGSGRKTIGSKAFSTDTGNDRVEFTFGAVTWTAINAGNPKYAILVKEITNDAASRLIAYLDLGTVVTNGSDMVLTPDGTAGALYVSA
jgi:hypothetical protein